MSTAMVMKPIIVRRRIEVSSLLFRVCVHHAMHAEHPSLTFIIHPSDLTRTQSPVLSSMSRCFTKRNIFGVMGVAAFQEYTDKTRDWSRTVYKLVNTDVYIRQQKVREHLEVRFQYAGIGSLEAVPLDVLRNQIGYRLVTVISLRKLN